MSYELVLCSTNAGMSGSRLAMSGDPSERLDPEGSQGVTLLISRDAGLRELHFKAM